MFRHVNKDVIDRCTIEKMYQFGRLLATLRCFGKAEERVETLEEIRRCLLHIRSLVEYTAVARTLTQ